jgi:hypothetical protein
MSFYCESPGHGENPFDLWLIKHINNNLVVQNGLDWLFSHTRKPCSGCHSTFSFFLYVIIRYGKKGAVWVVGFLITVALSEHYQQ